MLRPLHRVDALAPNLKLGLALVTYPMSITIIPLPFRHSHQIFSFLVSPRRHHLLEKYRLTFGTGDDLGGDAWTAQAEAHEKKGVEADHDPDYCLAHT